MAVEAIRGGPLCDRKEGSIPGLRCRRDDNWWWELGEVGEERRKFEIMF